MKLLIYKSLILGVLITIFIMMWYPYKVLAASIYAETTPTQLTETSLNGSIIRINLSGDEFISGLNSSYFDLVNQPAGTTIQSINLVNSNTVDITLYYKGDIDSDKTNFYIKVFKEGLKNKSGDLTSNLLPIKCVIEQIYLTVDPSPLEEDTLNNTILTLDLIGDEFIQNLTIANFQLRNPVTGLTIGNIERISNVKVKVYLSFNGTDFDTDVKDFAIRTLGSAFVRTSSNIDASQKLYAIVEGVPSIIATTKSLQLYENLLNGCIIRLTARQCTFNTVLYPENFKLNNAPTGTFIQVVNFVNSNTVELILGYDNTDFDADIANFNITALGSSLSIGSDLISNDVPIIAIKDYGQRRNFINTNESYPTDIIISGFNSNINELYINATLFTTKAVQSGQTIVFYYYIQVLNDKDELIGEIGVKDNLIIGLQTNTVNINNQRILLTSPITAKSKIVVTVVKTVL